MLLIGLVVVVLVLMLSGPFLLRRTVRGSGEPVTGRVWSLLLAINVLLTAVAMLAGAHSQSNYGWWTTLRERLTARDLPFEPFDVSGDPSLEKLLGGQQPARPEPAFDDPEEFSVWQEKLRRHLRREVFRMASPPTETPSWRVLSGTELTGGVTRQLLSFESQDGTTIPAYFFQPKDRSSRPAVLLLPGHGAGIIETAGLVPSYQHAAARKLAEAGYFVLTMELRGFGQLGEKINNEHRATAFNAIQAGSFYKAVVLQDIQIGFDLLASMPGVDRQRLAVTGVSLGGELTATFAALEPRVKVAVVMGYSGRKLKHKGRRSSGSDFSPHYCHIVPGQNLHFLDRDLFALCAPRPLLLVRGSKESAVSPDLRTFLGRCYGPKADAGDLTITTEDGGHEYFVAPAIEFLKRKL